MSNKENFSNFSNFSVSPRLGEAISQGVFFSMPFFTIAHLYTKTKIRPIDRVYKGHDRVYQLLLAKQDKNYPPILIADAEGRVNVNEPSVVLQPINEVEEAEEYLDTFLPRGTLKALQDVIKEYGIWMDNEVEGAEIPIPQLFPEPYKVEKAQRGWVIVNEKIPEFTLTSYGSTTAKRIAQKLDIPITTVEAQLAALSQYETNAAPAEAEAVKIPSLAELYTRNQLIYRPIKRLRGDQPIRDVDWNEVVSHVTNWRNCKDPRLVSVHKATLLKGIEPRLNAHALIVTNAGTGKSTYYRVTGKLYDKVTKNSLIGYAKSPMEIYPGTLDGLSIPVAMDQIESGNWGIMNFLFNIMEYGESLVTTGAAEFLVRCYSPIINLANPTVTQGDREGDFGALFSHLTENPAIGRRYGIYVYGANYRTINERESGDSLDTWRRVTDFFRAVEEYAHPQLVDIYKNPATWKYISNEIPEYRPQVVDAIRNIMNPTIFTLFNEHAKAGQSRVRAAALNISIVDHLDRIALNDITIDELIEYSDDVLPDIVALNLESINNLTKNFKDDIEAYAKGYWETAPEYIKAIIEGVNYARLSKILGSTFYLNSLDYKPTYTAYPYLSKAVDRLLRRNRGLVDLNQKLWQFFGFKFKPEGRDLKIFMDTNYKVEKKFLPDPVSPTPGETEKMEKKSEEEPGDPPITKLHRDVSDYYIRLNTETADFENLYAYLGRKKHKITKDRLIDILAAAGYKMDGYSVTRPEVDP